MQSKINRGTSFLPSFVAPVQWSIKLCPEIRAQIVSAFANTLRVHRALHVPGGTFVADLLMMFEKLYCCGKVCTTFVTAPGESSPPLSALQIVSISSHIRRRAIDSNQIHIIEESNYPTTLVELGAKLCSVRKFVTICLAS